MLDWALSKIIISIFTVGLIIFSIFVFSSKRAAIEEDKLRNISNRISSKVNELSNTYSNSSVYFTFSENVSAVTLPGDIDGENYEIRISNSWLTLETERKVASSDFTEEIHLWDPSNVNYTTNESELERSDDQNTSLKIVSGEERFKVVRCELIVSGEIQYHTFLYKWN